MQCEYECHRLWNIVTQDLQDASGVQWCSRDELRRGKRAMLSTVSLILLAHVLSALIIAQSSEFLRSLVLSISLELFEGRKCVTLCFKQENTSETCGVVYEGDPVALAGVGAHRERGPWISEWRSWRTLGEQLSEDGNGSALSLPERHGSQMGSAGWVDWSFRPVTRSLLTSSLMPWRW